tara:strand:- start:275 stop:1009 length:735 start_codon:yes stop_codon:yes gene_type:complete
VTTGPSKVDEILAVLRTEILRGQYRPGERMPSERDLAARFEINRGAVREVIKKLEQLGIIEVTPGGVRVLPVEEATLEVVPHLLELGTIDQQQIIGQLLDVLGTMMALSVHSALTLASEDEQQILAKSVDGLIDSIDENDEDLHRQSFKLLSENLLSINGNLILRLIGNGIRTQFIAHIRRENFNPNIDVERIKGTLAQFKAAILAGSPNDASMAIAQHFTLVKDAILTMPTNDDRLTRTADHA